MVEEDIREIRNAANRALTGVEKEDEAKVKDELAVVRRRLEDVENELGIRDFDTLSIPSVRDVRETFESEEDEGEDNEPEDEGWGIIGTAQKQSSRKLAYPEEDTVQAEVLLEASKRRPMSVNQFAAEADINKSSLSSALSHLYDKKMLEATQRRDVNHYYLSEEGEQCVIGQGLLPEDVDSRHREYRMMFGPMEQ